MRKINIEKKVEPILKKIEKLKLLEYLEMKNKFSLKYKKNNELLKCLTNSYVEDLEEIKSYELLGAKCVPLLEKEIEFNTMLISFYKDEIKKFIKLKEEFLKKIYCGKNEEAKTILQKLLDECGYSLWYIKNKIVYLELVEGTKYQKEFTKKIVENAKCGFFLRFVSYYTSYKVSMKNKEEFMKILDEFAECNQGKNEWIMEYFKNKFDYMNNYKDLDSKEVLMKLEMKISIYDGYERIIETIQEVIATQKKIDESLEIAIKNFYNEFKEVCDIRLDKIAETLELKELENNKNIVAIFDLYEQGDYLECQKKCEEIFDKNILSIEIYDIYINSSIKNNSDFTYLKESVLKKVFNLVKNLKLISDEPKVILNDLEYLQELFSKTPLGYWIYYITNFIKYSYKGEENFSIIYQLNTQNYDIKNCYQIFKNNIFNQLIEKNQKSLTLKLIDLFYNKKFEKIKELDLPEERKERYMIEGYLDTEEYEEILKLKDKIYSMDKFSFNSILKSYIISLIKSNKIEEALKKIIDEYLKNKKIHIFLPFEEMKNELEMESFDSLIELPIFYTIYSKEKERLETFDEFAPYEDFLLYHNLTKPSELLESKISDNFSKEKFNYYLENVCSIGVMELSSYIKGKINVIDERLKICKYLLSFGENPKIMSEVIDLNKQKLIINGVSELNKSKIKLDINELKIIISNKLGDQFKRYKLDLTEEKILQTKEDIKPFKFFQEENYEEELMESINLEQYFLNQASKIFLFNESFGLDTCLSTQIRHGVIKNAIRSVFENLDLITLKDENDKYLLNKRWISTDKLDKNNLKLNEILNENSKKIDEFCEKIIKDYLQINLESSATTKLFDYYLTSEEKNELEEKIKTIETVEELSEFLILELLEKTKQNLKKIKTFFGDSILKEFLDILSITLNSIKKIDLKNITELKDTIIFAKQNITNEVSQIKNWFDLKTKSDVEYYEVEYVKDLILQYIRCDVISTINVTSKLKGETLEDIFCILYNLIYNASVHSEEKPPSCNLKILEEDEIISIKAENKVYSDIENKRDKIKSIKEHLKNDVKIKLSDEGGSGFYKIKNVLDNKLKVFNTIDLGINEVGLFFVHITLKKERLLYEINND